MLQIITASILIMLASLAGVVTIWGRAGRFIERNLSFLVSGSAGVFLVITYRLFGETVEHLGDSRAGLAWTVAGAVLLLVIFRLLPNFHHHHNEREESRPHSTLDARRILLSDALHNVGDGILLAAAWGTDAALGAITTLSVFFHELVQEVSEFFVLRQAGLGARRALRLNFLVSGTILLGAVGSYFLLESFAALEGPLLGLAAGSFLIVVVHDLIPHSIRHSRRERHYAKHLFWFLLGLLLMFALSAFAGH